MSKDFKEKLEMLDALIGARPKAFKGTAIYLSVSFKLEMMEHFKRKKPITLYKGVQLKYR